MKQHKLTTCLWLAAAIPVLVAFPAYADDVAKVTNVQVKQTASGLEVILETTDGRSPQVFTTRFNETFEADIITTQLRLPSGKEFRVNNPAKGIASITVTQVYANTVRVRVTGDTGMPAAVIVTKDGRLVVSLTSPVPTAQQPTPTPEVTPPTTPNTPAAGQPTTTPTPEVRPSTTPTAPAAGQPTTTPTPEVTPPTTPTAPAAGQPTTTPTPKVTPPTTQMPGSNQPTTTEPEEIEITVTSRRSRSESGYKVPDATTATKSPVPLRDIPQSIEVVGRRVIEDRQVVRLDEFTDNVSGVHPIIGFGEATGYNIRGFFTSYQSLRNGFRDYGNPRDIANIERVEILKGPASVLYGGNLGLGGIVNTVTKKPLDTPFHSVAITADSYGLYRPTLDITGPLTANNSLLYRLNAAYENGDSYRDFTNKENFFVAPALTWRIDSKTTLSTEFEYFNSNFIFESGFPLVRESLRLPVNRFLSEPGLRRTHVDVTSITYNLEHEFSNNWKIRQGFNATINHTDVGDARLYTETLESNRRTLDRTTERGPQSNNNYTLQNEILGKFKTGFLLHNFLFGLELSRYNYSYTNFRGTLAPIDIFNPVYGAKLGSFRFDFAGETASDNLGVYFQDLVEILPNLKLLGGGRFDLSDSVRKDRPGGTVTNRLSDSKFSPRVGIVYQPIQSTSLYFNWSNFFNPVVFGISRTGEIFKPQTAEQFEVGIKQDLLANRLSTTLALYQITRQNVTTVDPVNRNFSIQTGEQKSRGVELDIAGQVSPGLNIIATYAYTNAFVSRDNRIPVGNQLVGVPHNGASLWTTYELQSGNLKGLGFGLGLVYSGDVQVVLPNTFKAPSYLRTDAALFYRQNNYRVGINIKNLFNVKYFYTDGGNNLFPAQPLTVLGTVSVQF